jgi:ABC-type Zn uptake system ZnuABC Zn-binding protein ZnuA
MIRWALVLAALQFLAGADVYASDPDSRLAVVATLPVLKDFVEQVGQNRVSVTPLLTGLESEHTYTPKPGDIIAIKQARLLIQIGLGLDIWVRGLIENSGNSDLAIVTVSNGIPLIRDDGASAGSPEARLHEGGNPHIWLDPENAKIMIREITDGLIKVDPSGKDFYLKNQGNYLLKIDQTESYLQAEMKGIRNRTIVSQHPAWPYFARRFGLKVAGNIVNQIGAEPSAKKIASLIQIIKKQNVKVIITEPQLSPKIPEMLAAETGTKLIVLSPLTGAIPGTESYIALMEYNVHQIIAALKD